ncbi:MAG TPA: glutaminyl-peptide cyclotransferase [Trueperaceae bacterium]
MARARPRLRACRALAALALALSSCGPRAAESLTVDVVRQLPHDPEAFTQGLELDGDTLYESTGLTGRSSLREVSLETGEVIRLRELPDTFAEGLTVVGDELLQLTWRDGVLYRWDKETFEPTGTDRYEGEGWGLCFDGEALWMSDGTDRLTRRDPDTFAVLGSVQVRRDGEPLGLLNELECVGEDVYANVWLTDEIVRIDPETGHVTATIDASPLRDLMPAGLSRDAVLNGIAYVEEREVFLLTGKLWPSAFEVRLVAAPSP